MPRLRMAAVVAPYFAELKVVAPPVAEVAESLAPEAVAADMSRVSFLSFLSLPSLS